MSGSVSIAVNMYVIALPNCKRRIRCYNTLILTDNAMPVMTRCYRHARWVLFQIFALALVAEGVDVNNKGDGDKKQQKRGNVDIDSGAASGSTGYSLGSAAEIDSSEKYIYGRYGLSSASTDLSSGIIGGGKIGLIPGSTGHGKIGLILGNIGHGSSGLSYAKGLLSAGGYGLRGYELGSHLGSGGIGLSSGGHDLGLGSGKIILLNPRGLEHGSGLDGIGVGSGLVGGAGVYGDIIGKGSGTGHVPVTTLTQKVPVPVPQPVPVIVSKSVPVSVPAPYPVEVPRLVPLSVPQAVRVTVVRPYPVAVTRPYSVAIPHHPAHVHVPQPVAVAVPVPQPVLVSSLSESGYSSGIGSLGPSAGGGYSTGSSHVSPVSSTAAGGHSGVLGPLELPSGGGYTYESSYGSSGLGLGHLSTPLKGVYVPSYLGGLHGSPAGQGGYHGTSGSSGVYAGSSSAGSGYGSYIKN